MTAVASAPHERISAAIRRASGRGPALVAFMTAGFPRREQFRAQLAAVAAVADVVGQPTQRSLTIWPPLRASIDDDLARVFDEVRCVMKLATSDAMKNELDLRVSGMPSVSFVEAF